MKIKKLLSLLIFPMIAFGQYTSIPDPVFEQTLIDMGYDNNIDGQVLTDNIIRVERLEFNGLQYWPPVSNFTGIQDFEALTQLSVRFIGLKNIEFLGTNLSLIYLNCQGNELTDLDLSNYPSLTYLNCESNQLTNLDLRSNKALTYLNCESNQLTDLDLRINNALNHLNCRGNELTVLDLSDNKALTYLNCESNQLTDLDLSNHTLLAELYCERDQLNSLNLGNNSFVKINNVTEKERLEKEMIKRNEILFYILVFFSVFIVVTAVWYLMKPKCSECNKKVFKKPEVLDTKFTDTTPTKKDGTQDKRYKKTGYWSKLKKWTCKCGHSWQKWV